MFGTGSATLSVSCRRSQANCIRYCLALYQTQRHGLVGSGMAHSLCRQQLSENRKCEHQTQGRLGILRISRYEEIGS